jgi:glycosyltransferase involved in cell wall biosynthesis
MPVGLHEYRPVATSTTGGATELDLTVLFKNDFGRRRGFKLTPASAFGSKTDMTRPLVGIDLAPANLTGSAPGTARHVAEIGRALAELDVSWDWFPTVESPENPFQDCFPKHKANILSGNSFARRAWWSLGRFWDQAGCRLGFATTCFVPFTGPPCVANLFDSNIYEHGDTWIQSGRRKAYWINRLASDHAVKRARKLFTLSDYCRNYLAARFPGAKEKFVTVPCGLSPLPAPSAQTPAWAQGLNRPFFIYVGTFSENKNQRRLLEAWVALQGAHPDLPGLVLAGPCPTDYRASVIEAALKRLPRPAEVLLPGRISNEDLVWAYKNALGMLQPSIAEGFGLPVIEAMSLGVPVACSNTTSLPETAGGAALLFDPFSPAKIGEAAKELWQDAALREKLSVSGKKRSQAFTWQQSAEKIAQEIDRQLASQG